MAAVLAFGRAAGVGFAGAWALAVGGALAAGTGLGARFGGFPRSLGGGVLDEDVVVTVDEVVVVTEVVESEAEERDAGDSGGSWTAGAGAGCWVLCVMRTRVRVRASGVCAPFPWCSACVRVLVLLEVSCVVCGGVVALSWPRWYVGYPGGGPLQLQDVWVCFLEVVEGAEQASLDAGHVLFREVQVVFGGGVWAQPQQGHEAGCHHVRAELHGGGAWEGGSHAVQGDLPLLGYVV